MDREEGAGLVDGTPIPAATDASRRDDFHLGSAAASHNPFLVAAARDQVAAADDHFGRLDIVVNNAGYGHFAAVEEVTDAELRDQLEPPATRCRRRTRPLFALPSPSACGKPEPACHIKWRWVPCWRP